MNARQVRTLLPLDSVEHLARRARHRRHDLDSWIVAELEAASAVYTPAALGALTTRLLAVRADYQAIKSGEPAPDTRTIEHELANNL